MNRIDTVLMLSKLGFTPLMPNFFALNNWTYYNRAKINALSPNVKKCN